MSGLGLTVPSRDVRDMSVLPPWRRRAPIGSFVPATTVHLLRQREAGSAL